jgi:hypothetical protein
MLSLAETAIVVLLLGIVILFVTMTSYSFRVQVSGEKKVAQSGIDYVIVKIQNYFMPTPSPPVALPTTYKEYSTLKEFGPFPEGIRQRKEGGAVSPHVDSGEKFKLV